MHPAPASWSIPGDWPLPASAGVCLQEPAGGRRVRGEGAAGVRDDDRPARLHAGRGAVRRQDVHTEGESAAAPADRTTGSPLRVPRITGRDPTERALTGRRPY